MLEMKITFLVNQNIFKSNLYVSIINLGCQTRAKSILNSHMNFFAPTTISLDLLQILKTKKVNKSIKEEMVSAPCYCVSNFRNCNIQKFCSPDSRGLNTYLLSHTHAGMREVVRKGILIRFGSTNFLRLWFATYKTILWLKKVTLWPTHTKQQLSKS